MVKARAITSDFICIRLYGTIQRGSANPESRTSQRLLVLLVAFCGTRMGTSQLVDRQASMSCINADGNDAVITPPQQQLDRLTLVFLEELHYMEGWQF